MREKMNTWTHEQEHMETGEKYYEKMIIVGIFL